MMPAPSPHDPQDGPQAGSAIGAPQAGWQGWGWGAAQGAGPPMQGERNSMNDGRRQLLAPPKQLLQPGAAARLPRTITRHRERHMLGISTTARPPPPGRARPAVGHDASSATTPSNPSSRSGTRSDGRGDFSKNFHGGRSPGCRPGLRGATVADAQPDSTLTERSAQHEPGKHVLRLRTVDESGRVAAWAGLHAFGVCLAAFCSHPPHPSPGNAHCIVLLSSSRRCIPCRRRHPPLGQPAVGQPPAGPSADG